MPASRFFGSFQSVFVAGGLFPPHRGLGRRWLPGREGGGGDGPSDSLPGSHPQHSFHWPELDHVAILVARDSGKKSTSFLASHGEWQGTMGFAMADGLARNSPAT